MDLANWPLLDAVGVPNSEHSRGGVAAASDLTGIGREVEFWLKEEDTTKGVWLLHTSNLETPNPYGGDPIQTFPEVVCTHRSLALLRLSTPHRNFPTDYFVYSCYGGAKGRPWVKRLPEIAPEIYSHRSVGILRAGRGDSFVVANLRREVNQGDGKLEAFLDLYCSEREEWHQGKVSLPCSFPMDELCQWETDGVVPFGGSLVWFDLSRGILEFPCLPVSQLGPIKYVPLPPELPQTQSRHGDHAYWWLGASRSIACCCDELKLVNLTSSPDHSAVVVDIWNLNMVEESWSKVAHFQLSDLWNTMKDHGVLQAQEDDDPPLCFPLLRADNDRQVLHLTVAGQGDKALLLQIDMTVFKKNEVLDMKKWANPTTITQYSGFSWGHRNCHHPLDRLSTGIIKLKDEHTRLHDLLEQPSVVESPDEQAKGWRDEARELRYDMEDTIDTSSANYQACQALIKCATDLVGKFNNLNLRESNVHEKGHVSFRKPDHLVGIRRPKEKIIGLLSVSNRRVALSPQPDSIGHRVVSIVGLGGSGKTTLAREVYNEIATEFECTAQVSLGPVLIGASPDLKMKGVLISLLRQFGAKNNQIEHPQKEHLLSLIKQHVHDKRFLVIVDDIWDKTEWMVIRDALLCNYSGGRVVMTTRTNSIASLGDYVYHIPLLNKTNSKLLLLKEVFGSEKCPSDLEDPSEKILEKCGGLPLAIIAMSSVLKNEKSVARWMEAYNSFDTADAEDPIKQMRMTLSLGYFDLPFPVRMCLLFLSIFPARHEIRRKRLLHRWIAQRLVEAQDDKNLVELGETYFNELIDRNWIEPVNIEYDGQARACRVHSAILAFIVCKSAEENLITLLGRAEKKKKKIRNLSIQNMPDVTQLGNVSHVRSLTIFGHIHQLSSPVKSDALRDVDLEDAHGSDDANKCVVDDSSLHQLRSLILGTAGFNGRLGKKMKEMQHLETLDLRKRQVEEGHELDITSHLKLIHLYVTSKTTLKGEIWKLKALEEVKYISVSKHSEVFVKELSKLTKLRVLGIHLDVDDTLDEQKKAVALISWLRELGNCNLHSLSIDGIGEISLLTSSYDDSSQPALPSLKKLKFGKWCYINEIPRWVGSFRNVEKLRLGISKISQDQLALLGALPSLIYLFLDILEVHGKGIIFESHKGFRNLMFLVICFRTLAKVEFESESMPLLEHLKFSLDVRGLSDVKPEDRDIILGIKKVSLKRFDALIYCRRETDAVVKVIKDALQNDGGDGLKFKCMVKPQRTETVGQAMCYLLRKVNELAEDQVRELKAGISKRQLRDMLAGMIRFLLMLSDDDNPKHHVKECKDAMREFCYDLEDAIHGRLVVKMDPSSAAYGILLNQLKLSFGRMDGLLPKGMNQNLTPEQQIQYYMAGTSGPWPAAKVIDPRLAALHWEAANLVGTKDQREALIGTLSPSDLEKGLKVVSIFGFGGIGKTALAKEVFHGIKGYFACAAFVTVSRKLYINMLIKDILLQFDRAVGEKLTEDDPRSKDIIQAYIQDKRYFIVLDDIWTETDWKKIKNVLSDNDMCSRIITTTRIKTVAKKCCSSDANLHSMKPLDFEDSKVLFLRRIGSKEWTPDLEQISNEVVKKCGGSPLAILTVSSLLTTNSSPSRWKEVLMSMGPGISKEPGAEYMRRTLSYSYCDLRYHVRMCLLYLSIFPEDYEINTTRLINKWIAEDLIEAEPGKTKFEVGEGYFYELINRSLIQPVKLMYEDKVKVCRVHDTILDFIVSKSVEENFVTLLSAQWKMSDKKIHRLSLQYTQEEDVSKLKQGDLSQVRSLTIFGSAEKMPSSRIFPILRVLDLEDCYEPYPRNCGDKGYPVGDVRGLYHLEYLQLRPIGTEMLPEQIGDLLRLQTLDLRETDIELLPESITKIASLERLLVYSHTKLPERGFEKMEALEELVEVDVGEYSKNFLKTLGKLRQLRVLGILFEPSKMDQEKEEALLSSLSKLVLCKLHSLSINVLDVEGGIDDELVHFGSRWKGAVQSLHKLSMKGYISKVPTWMENMDKLKKLRLGVSRMEKKHLDILGRMKSLLSLFLDFTNFTQESVVTFSSSNGFKTLEYFGIQSKIMEMAKLKFEDGCMPGVKHIKIRLKTSYQVMRPEPGDLEFGIQLDGPLRKVIEHLKSLWEIDVTIWCHRRSDEVVNGTIATMKSAADNHQNKPTLKFEIHPWVSEMEDIIGGNTTP